MAFTATQSATNYNVVLGLQSTADWSDTNFIPGDWLEMVLRLWPNGEAPLTAMLSKLPSKVTTDTWFHWFTEMLGAQNANITGVYSDAGMATAITGATSGALGDMLYLKCAAANAKEFRAGHIVMLRNNDNANSNANPNGASDTIAMVLGVIINGANSQLAVQLMESANDSAGRLFDYALITGNANPENSEAPDAVSYQPTEDYNYTQIWRTPLEIAGTTLAQETRIGDWYQHEKENCLRYHAIEMEKSFLWGIPYKGVGSNGKPLRMTGGIVRKLSTNVFDYPTAAAYAGKTWTNGGEDWILDALTQMFKYGSDERLVYAGTGAINAFGRIAKANGHINITPGQAEYGIKVMTYEMPFGVIHLKRHPLFSYELVNQYSMIALEPANLKYRPMKGRDTAFRPDILIDKGGWTDRDGTKEGYLTESGLQMSLEPTFGYFTGVGKDSAV